MAAIESNRAIETFKPRGIGSNTIRCFVCGSPEPHTHDTALYDGTQSVVVQPDMASFVQSRESGLKVVSFFEKVGSRAVLDFRSYEPNWIQVKTGACQSHKENLERLERMVNAADATISPDIIRWAMQPLPGEVSNVISIEMRATAAEIISAETGGLMIDHAFALRRKVAGLRLRPGTQAAADIQSLDAMAVEYIRAGRQISQIITNLPGRLELAYWRSLEGK